jgi:hypoxanthine phosphoribosyltransferase
MNTDLKKTLVSETEIQDIITRISNQINEDYRGKNLLICGVLKGALMFMSDLIRKINTPAKLEISFIKASSYGQSTVSSKNIQVDEFYDFSRYKDKDFEILLVDDILDTGYTLSYLQEYFMGKNLFSDANICVLLDKYERREKPVCVKYIGKQIQDEFVVGYGLDYDEKYRELPYIGAIYTT